MSDNGGGMGANDHHHSGGIRHAPIMTSNGGVSTDATTPMQGTPTHSRIGRYDVAADGRFRINAELHSAGLRA
jgi:hypothetical protein